MSKRASKQPPSPAGDRDGGDDATGADATAGDGIGLPSALAALDAELLDLLRRRGRLLAELPATAVPSVDAVVRALPDETAAGLPPVALRAIFREVHSAGQAAAAPVRVAYFGPAGTYTHQAAMRHFGHGVTAQPEPTILNVFEAVEHGYVTYGVVPVENSTEGAVTVTFDLFQEANVVILGEIYMRIRHHLLSDGELDQIRTVYSHPQALAQCRGWLQQHLPGRECIETAGSTTAAAHKAAGDPTAAAIAGSMAAELAGIPIRCEGIEDVSGNTTRFLVLGRQPSPPTGDDKTSIMFAIKDRVGALYEALVPFKENGVSLTMIQSRPSKKKMWDYHFYVDFLGHADGLKNAEALARLESQCKFLKILGSYPRRPDAL